MTVLKLRNPFNAPVYHEETVSSTMDVSRKLAGEGTQHGSPNGVVILADFQESGRGRKQDRKWEMESGANLSFTVLLKFPCIEEIPSALTLRAGLAVCLAIEDFAPCLQGSCLVKWPNDILIKPVNSEVYKKAVGILCEADGGNVHLGIGINTAQKEFPPHLREKAVSIALAAGIDISREERFILLEKILSYLYSELGAENANNWKPRLEQKLYKKNEQVLFIEGAAGSGKEVKGRLVGITENGELLIIPDGETQASSFITGELNFF
jgi:BirA family transcriptional regulator, biotin operon repressor / biotin---[acetyl-CoA-carboxylase] ligase